jgi:hypothetical protein
MRHDISQVSPWQLGRRFGLLRMYEVLRSMGGGRESSKVAWVVGDPWISLPDKRKKWKMS